MLISLDDTFSTFPTIFSLINSNPRRKDQRADGKQITSWYYTVISVFRCFFFH